MYSREKKLISICIPSWFTKEQHGKYGMHETYWFAARCLEKLLARTDRNKFELIIVDNGSTIQDEDVVDRGFWKNKGQDVYNEAITFPSEYWKQADILIKNKSNVGFGPACNEMFNVANGEYIVCMNNDIVVWENWEDELIAVLENKELSPAPGIAMPALMKQSRDAVFALLMNKESVDLSMNNDKIGAGAEFGSLFMFKRELMDKIKKLNKDELGREMFFDERFILGFSEDRDLYRNTRSLGHETYRTHKTRVYHMGNATISKVKDKKEYTSKNRELLNEKWGT
jgi:GT2 family glycosyltransferase